MLKVLHTNMSLPAIVLSRPPPSQDFFYVGCILDPGTEVRALLEASQSLSTLT